jgi:hypothetical protein
MSDVLHELSSMKFLEPSEGQEANKTAMKALQETIKQRFRQLDD